MDLPKRKPNRLPAFDYSTPGAYFITICTQDMRPILGTVVGGGALDAPSGHLTEYGRIIEHHILSGDRIPSVRVDKYVIMPNHIHMILLINGVLEPSAYSGTSRAPSPTNAVIPRFVSVFKRLCHQEIGKKIFQRSYHDHVIRDTNDYQRIWQYIDNNPSRWCEDCFYTDALPDQDISGGFHEH